MRSAQEECRHSEDMDSRSFACNLEIAISMMLGPHMICENNRGVDTNKPITFHLLLSVSKDTVLAAQLGKANAEPRMLALKRGLLCQVCS